MKRFVVAAVAAAGFAFAGAASASANLIQDGSFENFGDGTGAIGAPWVYSAVSPDVDPATVIDYNSGAGYPTGAFNEPIPAPTQVAQDPDAVGTHAAYFVADNATETLSQTIATLAPGVYTIGFSAYVPQNGFDNQGDATFSGMVAGQTLVTFDVHASGALVDTWTNYVGTLTVGPGDTGPFTTQFSFHSDPGASADVVIDQVFVVAGAPGSVPEPASWALMILGFGGAGVAMRSRRRQALAA
jgi:PEP-CTERM motif